MTDARFYCRDVKGVLRVGIMRDVDINKVLKGVAYKEGMLAEMQGIYSVKIKPPVLAVFSTTN